MIKVNTKSMPINKGINSDLLGLAKDLDNAALRKNDENDEIINDNFDETIKRKW